MGNRNTVVLLQYREDPQYNDFVGTFYHFPKKYSGLLQTGAEFVYYNPKNTVKANIMAMDKFEGSLKTNKFPITSLRKYRHINHSLSPYRLKMLMASHANPVQRTTNKMLFGA